MKRNCKSWFWSSFVLCFAKTIGSLIPPHPLTNFEIQKNQDLKVNQDLMMFIQEIIYQKK